MAAERFEADPLNQAASCRLALCCQFAAVPIKFRTATASRALRMPNELRLNWLGELCRSNLAALFQSLEYCAEHAIGGFRIGSWLFPVATHPEAGYRLEDLPQQAELRQLLADCNAYAATNRIRLTFHPDQYTVLNSPRDEVVTSAICDLEHHALLAEWLGADAINIHAGGAYGDKPAALARLAQSLERLSSAVRERLTVENDDTVYTPADLLPWCRENGIPLVYDVHHHRCLRDDLGVEEATDAAMLTWNREPLVHVSSPVTGWFGPYPERHHDYIDWCDFPQSWCSLPITVEVEAKAKELAVLRLRDDLHRHLSRKQSRGREQHQAAFPSASGHE